MDTSNPLVKVDFVDNSNYAPPVETGDVVGVVVDTDWGPVNKLTVLDRTAWEAFADPTRLAAPTYSMACVDRIFSAGASFVEVVRIDPNNTVFFGVKEITPENNTDPNYAITAVKDANYEAAITKLTGSFSVFSLKYPGTPKIGVAFSSYKGDPRSLPKPLQSAPVATLGVYLGTSESPVESFLVTFKPDVYVDGESYYIGDVISKKSRYLAFNEEFEPEADWENLAETGFSDITFLPADDTSGYKPSVDDFKKAYSLFEDRDQSTSTILVSTMDPSATELQDLTAVLNIIMKAAETRMDCISIVGCPRETFGSADLSKVQGDIVTYFQGLTQNVTGRFNNTVAATERYRYKNTTFYLDGTHTVAGRMCAIAEQNNRNTLPSYKATGLTDAVLTNSLKFKQVVELMEDYGIGSIYSTPQGNYIFNIRTSYALQSSYFGKLNVARVTAAFLRWLLTDVEYTIHQDTVSDTLELLSFEKTENLKLQQMVSLGELKSQSIIIANPTNNTDAMTNGGECLNIDAELWFKKLTERVRIRIIATDITTSVEVS